MDIFAHTISYVTVDTKIARFLAFGSQLFFHGRFHWETEEQLAFITFKCYYLPVTLPSSDITFQ